MKKPKSGVRDRRFHRPSEQPAPRPEPPLSNEKLTALLREGADRPGDKMVHMFVSDDGSCTSFDGLAYLLTAPGPQCPCPCTEFLKGSGMELSGGWRLQIFERRALVGIFREDIKIPALADRLVATKFNPIVIHQGSSFTLGETPIQMVSHPRFGTQGTDLQ